MVSLAATSKKYRGRKATTYDEIRTKQQRWRLENEAVERMLCELEPTPKKVLDVPCGTGRFFAQYNELDCHVIAVDISDEMLELARKRTYRGGRIKLELGNAVELSYKNDSFDVAVCVRFLDLIDEDAMRKVVRELCRVAANVVCTIRFGEKYVPKVNTAEHDEKKFRALVRGQGFEIVEQVPIFKAGWHVVHMRRRNK